MRHLYQLRVFPAALALAAGGLFASCQSANLHIVRTPFVSPIVVPSVEDGVFYMNVAVQNDSDEPYGQTYLWIKVEYPDTWSAGPPCASYDDFVAVPPLDPGESWGLADYRIDRGSTQCPCVKDACDGHLWLNLVWAPVPGPSLPGPDTSMHVDWEASGSLAELKITSN